jgi:hypothetical protein
MLAEGGMQPTLSLQIKKYLYQWINTPVVRATMQDRICTAATTSTTTAS